MGVRQHGSSWEISINLRTKLVPEDKWPEVVKDLEAHQCVTTADVDKGSLMVATRDLGKAQPLVNKTIDKYAEVPAIQGSTRKPKRPKPQMHTVSTAPAASDAASPSAPPKRDKPPAHRRAPATATHAVAFSASRPSR